MENHVHRNISYLMQSEEQERARENLNEDEQIEFKLKESQTRKDNTPSGKN